MSAKLISIGNGFILLTHEEFASSYQAGHLAYMVEKHRLPCSDQQLTSLFLERLEDVHYSSPYGIGFIVGWIITLANKGLTPREVVSIPAVNEERG